MAGVMIGVAFSTFFGCGAVNRTFLRQVEKEAATLTPEVTDDSAVKRVAETTAANRNPHPERWELPQGAGLEFYIEAALERNPAIKRAIRNVQALGYRVPQVTSLDDPVVNIVPPIGGDMAQTAAGVLQGALGIAQKIPFPGKLTSRGKIAEQAARMALDTLADVRITTVAQVKKAYYDYYLADVSVRINRESEDLLRQIRDVAEAKYRAGLASQQDVLRAEVELYTLTNELITLEQQRASARALLNALMDRHVDAPLPPPPAFDLDKVEWKLTEAMDRAVAKNPRLAMLRNQIRRDLEAIKLAKLDYFPDVNLGYNYTFVSSSGLSPIATGDDTWSLALQFNLPIWWQKLRAGVLEGNAQVLSSVEQYEEVRNLIFFSLQDTLVKVDTQYRQGVLYRDLIVPRAWQTVEVSQSGYQAGKIDFTTLVDNWRKWLDAALGYHRALAAEEQRFADLQQLIGLRVGRSPESLETRESSKGEVVSQW